MGIQLVVCKVYNERHDWEFRRIRRCISGGLQIGWVLVGDCGEPRWKGGTQFLVIFGRELRISWVGVYELKSRGRMADEEVKWGNL